MSLVGVLLLRLAGLTPLGLQQPRRYCVPALRARHTVETVHHRCPARLAARATESGRRLCGREVQLELRGQLLLRVEALREVDPPDAAVGVDLHAQSLDVIRACAVATEMNVLHRLVKPLPTYSDTPILGNQRWERCQFKLYSLTVMSLKN